MHTTPVMGGNENSPLCQAWARVTCNPGATLRAGATPIVTGRRASLRKVQLLSPQPAADRTVRQNEGSAPNYLGSNPTFAASQPRDAGPSFGLSAVIS